MGGRESETSTGPCHGKPCVHVKELDVYHTGAEATLQGGNQGKHMLRSALHRNLFSASVLLNLC